MKNEIEQSAIMSTSPCRRDFLSHAGAVGLASLLGLPRLSRAEPPPETTTIRIPHTPAICLAPQYLAEELLRLEGFTDVQYIELQGETTPLQFLTNGRADISMDAAQAIAYGLGNGSSAVVLGGIHSGCYELFGHERVRTLRDLKGKNIAIAGVGSGDHVLLSSILTYVGLDPHKDVNWMMGRMGDEMAMFAEGKADAVMCFPPQPQELRARKIGRVILDTAYDKPWSQYFCCMVAANRDFLSRHPVAAKRALRAFLKAADLCATQPARAAAYLQKREFEPRYEIGLEVLQKLSYPHWRHAEPEDSLRFYALRLHEGGLIKASPQKLIAQGADWRFFNELKKELKA
jgi:NitT/TauT family transport system substrate-binding protein